MKKAVALSLGLIPLILLGIAGNEIKTAIARPKDRMAGVAKKTVTVTGTALVVTGTTVVEVPKTPIETVPAKAAPRVILTPLGTSSKLDKSQLKRLERSRRLAVKFAQDYPDAVYLNGRVIAERIVCLTFDDGPDPKFTPRVLDILARYNVKGSFFFIGERVGRFPLVARRADREGNLVLNHTQNHANLTGQTPEKIAAEFAAAEDEISRVTGRRRAIIRPPYGGLDINVIREADKNHYKIALWSLDTFDWLQRDKSHIAENIVNNVRPGDIVLMHSTYQATVAALPEIIIRLREKGYRFEDLGEMLQVNPYKPKNRSSMSWRCTVTRHIWGNTLP